jgi:threonine dehydratase
MEKITIEKINQAAAVLSKILTPTPLIRNEWLSKNFGCEVFLKLETMQPIGSFKIRGATYKISQLSEADRKKGVIAASAGNHAQGVAWGARYFNANALIVMPETAPLMKIQNTRELGAEVHLEGDNYDESYQVAQRIVKESGRIYVHAFHDETVIAGQATTALEILSQCPDVDYVVSSIGGGGLTAGIGIVLKKLKPAVKLIGCQAQNASAMTKSISKKRSKSESRFI